MIKYVSVLFCTSLVWAEQLIQKKTILRNHVYFSVCPELRKRYVRKSLHVGYPEDINLNDLPPTIIDIPLITNLIPVIWFSGKEYTIDEMDEDLYYSLIKIKSFFKRFFYNTAWKGELRPARLVKNVLPHKKNQAAALFTGGLDSTTTIFRHFNENLVLISFNTPHKNALAFARMHHFDFYTIYMNYYDFLKLSVLDKASVDISKWFWDTTMGLSWIGAAAPFLYAKGIPLLYIPSGFTWQSFIFPDGQTLQQPASPLIDENVTPAGIIVHHDIFTMTRTEKMEFISTFCTERRLPKPHLVVCNYHSRLNNAFPHCNKCMKCLLTMLDIIAIGENLHDYGFTLAEQEFILQFKSYITALKMRRGGTYVACSDTQKYIKRNIGTLPHTYQQFYEWFMEIDLWKKINTYASRPPRKIPFCWDEYKDLYKNVPPMHTLYNT